MNKNFQTAEFFPIRERGQKLEILSEVTSRQPQIAEFVYEC